MNNFDLMTKLRTTCVMSMSEKEKTALLVHLKLADSGVFTPKESEFLKELTDTEYSIVTPYDDDGSAHYHPRNRLTTQALTGFLLANVNFNYLHDWPYNFQQWLAELSLRGIYFGTESLKINNLRLLLTREGLENFNQVFPKLKRLEFVDHGDEAYENALITVADVREILPSRVTLEPFDY